MATDAAAKSYGFEWRTLLGPTHNWSIPAAGAQPNHTTKKLDGML